jgi:hypothetical protein
MADGVHKERANYYDNIKEPYRTNVYGNMRAERLPQALQDGECRALTTRRK